MQIPLKQSESSPESLSPGNTSSVCDPVRIAQEAVALRERKMQIMSTVFEKIEAHEERVEKRIQSWLDRARNWQQERQQ